MSVREKLSLFENPNNATSANSPASTQEDDLLLRSGKKIKEPSSTPLTKWPTSGSISSSVTVNPEIQPEPMAIANLDAPIDTQMSEATTSTGQSYREKLLLNGESSATIVSFATTPEYMDEDSDVDDDPNDPTPIVLLSKAEKKRIREPWMNSIIIKPFHHKTLGYNYIYPRLKAQWKPSGKWDFIDLGFDFFLVRFQVLEDLNRVIFGGPWFVGPFFLTIRRWEPNFDPAEAVKSMTTTAVWARLPNLSADHYDPDTLQKIGNKVGTLLRVDAHTAHHTRGQYARICVQIDLSQPVAKVVRIGKKRQKVAYEGINALCFNCGRIGHRNGQCPEMKLNCTKDMNGSINIDPCREESLSTNPTPTQDRTGTGMGKSSMSLFQERIESELKSEEGFGPWLIVERRKPKKKGPVPTIPPEKVASGNRVANQRGSKSLNRKVGPKPGGHSNGSHTAQPNGSISEVFNAVQGRSNVNISEPISIQTEIPNGQHPKGLQWVPKPIRKAHELSISKEPLEPQSKLPIPPPTNLAQHTPESNAPSLHIANHVLVLNPSSQTKDISPQTPNNTLIISASDSPATSSHSPTPFVSTPPATQDLTPSCLIQANESSNLPAPTPKPPDLSSAGPSMATITSSIGEDAGRKLAQKCKLDDGSDNGSLASPNHHIQGCGAPGGDSVHSASTSLFDPRRDLSNIEPRVFRRRNQTRRGIGPYSTSSSFQLSLHATLENDRDPGESGLYPSSSQTDVLPGHEVGNGLRVPDSTISLPTSEVPSPEQASLTAYFGAASGPDSLGPIQP
ncbi:hypothetical protein SLA2020_394690 [Shorea laevis]